MFYLLTRFEWIVTWQRISFSDFDKWRENSRASKYHAVWYFVIIQVRDILEKTVVSFLSLFRILLHNKENLLKSTRPMHIKSFFSEYYLSQKSLRMYIIHTHAIQISVQNCIFITKRLGWFHINMCSYYLLLLHLFILIFHPSWGGCVIWRSQKLRPET